MLEGVALCVRQAIRAWSVGLKGEVRAFPFILKFSRSQRELEDQVSGLEGPHNDIRI